MQGKQSSERSNQLISTPLYYNVPTNLNDGYIYAKAMIMDEHTPYVYNCSMCNEEVYKRRRRVKAQKLLCFDCRRKAEIEANRNRIQRRNKEMIINYKNNVLSNIKSICDVQLYDQIEQIMEDCLSE